MNPLSMFIAWRARRKARKALEAAERQRHAIIAQKANRKAEHRAFRYLDGILIDATCRSLAASSGREWVR
jgi:hypothetical protein